MLPRFFRPPARRSGAAQAGRTPPEAPFDRDELARVPLSRDLSANLALLRATLGSPDDLIMREFLVANRYRAAVAGIDGLIDRDQAHAHVMRALMLEASAPEISRQITQADLAQQVRASVLAVAEFRRSPENLAEAVDALLAGGMLLFLDGHDLVFNLDLRRSEQRAIDEPLTETVIRGPRESFVENLRTNTSLVRRKLRTPNLRFEEFRLGRETQTKVFLCYLQGTANEELVAEARRRLGRIDIDGVLESSYVEEFIEDSPFSPFPQMLPTERPDVVAAALLEGRFAVLTDGTPFALVAPATYIDFLISPEDYYVRVQTVLLARLLRILAAFLTVTLPSIYVSLVTFHHEMIPTPLALSIAAGREGTPFPAFVEALLMQLVFEVLREAGARLPRQLGQAISIVGALVIGQAAVAAGLISPLMIIVIALTGIGSFTIPLHAMVLALRVLSIPMLFLAGTLGFVGLTFGLVLILAHLASLRSFGVPYLAPFAPGVVPDLMKDTVTRLHWWWMDTRPWYIAQRNLRRQVRGRKPAPPAKPRGGPRDPAARGKQ